MYNFRYHIATLVAVFLALALGLFLGAAIVGSGTVSDGSKTLVEGLRAEFSDLRDQNETLDSALSHEEALSNYMTTTWATGRLADQRILVVATSDKEPGIDEVGAAIEAAGGTQVRLVINESLTREKAVELGLVKDDAAADTADETEVVFETEIAKAITSEIALPADQRATINALVEAKIITLAGADEPTSIAGCADIAARDGVADPLAMQIAVVYTGSARPAFAGKLHAEKNDIVAAGMTAKVSTLDTLEGSYGLQGTVALLTGAPAGNYGVDQPETNWFPKVPYATTKRTHTGEAISRAPDNPRYDAKHLRLSPVRDELRCVLFVTV